MSNAMTAASEYETAAQGDLIAAMQIPYVKAVLTTALDVGCISTSGLSRVQAAAVEALAAAGALSPAGEGRFALTQAGARAALTLVRAAPGGSDPRTAGARLTARLWG